MLATPRSSPETRRCSRTRDTRRQDRRPRRRREWPGSPTSSASRRSDSVAPTRRYGPLIERPCRAALTSSAGPSARASHMSSKPAEAQSTPAAASMARRVHGRRMIERVVTRTGGRAIELESQAGDSTKERLLQLALYLTNEVIANIPSATLRHLWYRRILG